VVVVVAGPGVVPPGGSVAVPAHASVTARLAPPADACAVVRMQTAAFTAGAMSVSLTGGVDTLAGLLKSIVLGEGVVGDAPPPHAVERSTAAAVSVGVAGTVAMAFARMHVAAVAAGARSAFVPVVMSDALVGADVSMVDGVPPPGAAAAHNDESCAVVGSPTVPFARRQVAAATTGAASTSVPVRSLVSIVPSLAVTVDGPPPGGLAGPPHSVDSDALTRSVVLTPALLTLPGSGLATSARRQIAARSAASEETCVPLDAFARATPRPPSAVDAVPSHGVLSVAIVGSTLACARRQRIAFAPAAPVRVVPLTGSLAPTLALAL
jgi:hypothetical protein